MNLYLENHKESIINELHQKNVCKVTVYDINTEKLTIISSGINDPQWKSRLFYLQENTKNSITRNKSKQD